MKFASILIAAMLALAAPAVYAHAEHGQPQHGGIYGEAGTFQAELLIKDREAVLYLSNHGEPLSSQGASGKLTILSSSGKVEIELKPSGDNRLRGQLPARPAAGSKMIATLTLAGMKPAHVRYSLD
jgi:hypothetical protein